VNGHPQDLSLREQARAIDAGELDATELLEATLARIEERDGPLNSIVDRFAIESAQMLSEAPEGPLHGVPIAVKDMFNLPWRAPRDGAVRSLSGMEPGESVVYRRLRDAGAVIVGVTNMHEFGMGSTGHISVYGPSANPWDAERCAGGSSGGSGAAVSARLVAGAVGSDGGGSIRYPASYCGVTGLKFTWGLLGVEGYTSHYSTMSTGGPMCRDAADTRLLGEVLLGRPFDTRRAAGLRLGVVRDLWSDLDPDVEARCRDAVEALRDAGVQVMEVELDALEFVRISTVIQLPLEGTPSARPEILAEIRDQVSPIGRALGKYQLLMPAAAAARVARVRAALRRSVARAFERVDVLAWPATPAPAPQIENPTVMLPSGPQPADFANTRLGGIANLTGVPATSLPVGLTSEGLPAGLSMLAPWKEDERLLDLAELLEQQTGRRHVDAAPPLATEAVA
jgi:Asp-tRNA(Asn)/Glu-tRNA(Gln) amidotransferase A subunit family amidase